MPYLHGVYTSESPTSVVPTVDAASCLPFVIGTAPDGYDGESLVRCRNWQEFKAAFGAAESYEGADPSTLATFARQWYKRAGAGDALFFVASGESDEEDPDPGTQAVGVWSYNGSEGGEGTHDVSFMAQDPGASGNALSVKVSIPEAGSILFELYRNNQLLQSVSGSFDSRYPGNSVDWAFCMENEEISSLIMIQHSDISYEDLIEGGDGTPPTITIQFEGGSGGAGSITDALAALDTVYERFGLVVTVVLCPRTGIDSASEIAAKVQKFGSGWSAIALIDLPYDWGNAAPELPLKSSYLVYCSPRCKAGSEIVDASCVVAGAMAATDASAGGFPYVSPSNKLAYIDGIVDENSDPLFLSQPDVNDLFNANAVVSFLHNAKGWVVWGNNTGYYSPSATDPKDRWISIRRTFCYIRNDFLVFGASRIDNPINKRQLDGVVNAYNQRLKGLVGVGAVNSASIALSDRNTAETLLGGAVFVDVRISPPPPMENLDATFEYDVEGFVSSLS